MNPIEFTASNFSDVNRRQKADVDCIGPEVEHSVERMCDYILHTADYTRSDRLWPADFMIFLTNSLSIAYGACGPVLFLHEVLKKLPPPLVDWLLAQPLSADTHPPGLYMGLAGIAYTFFEIGCEEKAEEVMKELYKSSLLYKEPGMLIGAAGWGMASLAFHTRTGKQAYLDRAVLAGEHLLDTSKNENGMYCWHVQNEPVHYGFGHGATGIALFLLYLHVYTSREDFLQCAIQSLEFDLANKVESNVGWQWKRHEGDNLLYPYWIHGSAGIGSTLIRFHHYLGIDRYEDLARKVAEDTFIKYSFTPGLFEGLTGIGEFMLDMYHFTGERDYRRKSLDIADSILWFKIEKPEGIAYPGRWLTRISNDYATGAAGIGLFLTRILRNRNRLIVDQDVE